jgi:hypothetical protein
MTRSHDGGAMPAKALDRRAALRSIMATTGGLLTVPALAVGVAAATLAAAPSIDPVFAAIERHKTAFAAFNAACPRLDSALADQEGRTITEDDQDAYDEAQEGETEAFEAMADLPTSIAGLRALLAYIVEYEDPDSVTDTLIALLDAPILALPDAVREVRL